MTELDPALLHYFGAIPLGHIGRATGVFDTVGNRPTGHGSIQARRTFHFDSGDAVMTEEIGITPAGSTDRLGRRGLVVGRIYEYQGSFTYRIEPEDGPVG
jgi:hypothetical protein